MSKSVVSVESVNVEIGDYLALCDLELKIPEGAFVAIVGPNGAGKSTFLKVLLGLIEPTSGHVRVFGKDPADVSPELVGYVPQAKTMDRSFPALSIELVYTGLTQRWPWRFRKERRQMALSALGKVGAAHLADRPIGRLSGGELQRVCMARSFVRSPKLMMLDEPATGIDAVGEEDMYRMLEDYQQQTNATILMITHDWHAATHHADFVLLLNRKQISFGTPGEALNEEYLRKAYGHIGHKHKLKFLIEAHE
ncbi:ATP-binding cassette domain-containing protein [candidate division KSB1 bacterium]|nr:ATP-binding cassette domain-containing protein [candidate division KSB1 bacterium]